MKYMTVGPQCIFLVHIHILHVSTPAYFRCEFFVIQFRFSLNWWIWLILLCTFVLFEFLALISVNKTTIDLLHTSCGPCIIGSSRPGSWQYFITITSNLEWKDNCYSASTIMEKLLVPHDLFFFLLMQNLQIFFFFLP